MGTSLTGLTPATTYDALIKVGDNGPIDGTLKTLSDGLGNDLPMQASTAGVNFTGTLSQSGTAVPTAAEVAAKQDTLVSGTNIKTINSTSILGSGNLVVSASPSGVAGAIQFSDGSAFASDAANLFWDDTNNRLGIGTNAPATTLDIQGSGSSFTTFSFNVSNSSSQSLFKIRDDGTINASASSLSLSSFVNANDAVIGSSSLLSARLGIKGSGSTSATTSLLVQNSAGSTSLKVTDDQQVTGFSGAQLQFRLGFTSAGQSISTREGQFSVGLIDANQSAALRFLTLGTGSTYIDGYTEGVSKAQNYPLFIGSRASNTGALVTNSTTQENGTQTIFGSAVSDASALVQINSTTRGFLPPRMTTTQKNAISSPATGLVVYDSTTKSPGYYDGTNWGYTGGALQNAAGNSGTLNISFADGNIVNLTLNANTTLAFSNSVIGTYIIQVTQGATGANTLTYPASVKWSGGTAPTLTTTVGKTDILTFYHDGTSFFGTYSLNY